MKANIHLSRENMKSLKFYRETWKQVCKHSLNIKEKEKNTPLRQDNKKYKFIDITTLKKMVGVVHGLRCIIIIVENMRHFVMHIKSS